MLNFNNDDFFNEILKSLKEVDRGAKKLQNKYNSHYIDDSNKFVTSLEVSDFKRVVKNVYFKTQNKPDEDEFHHIMTKIKEISIPRGRTKIFWLED